MSVSVSVSITSLVSGICKNTEKNRMRRNFLLKEKSWSEFK